MKFIIILVLTATSSFLMAQNIGIGTPSPQEMLHIEGGDVLLKNSMLKFDEVGSFASSTTGTLNINGNQNVKINSKTTKSIQFMTAGVEYARFDASTFSLGIGIPSPEESIHITGAIKFGAARGSSLGTLQWDGTDFKGRTADGWKSLLIPNQVQDEDGDTKIVLNESPNENIQITVEGSPFMELENDTDGGHIINYFPDTGGGTYEKITHNFRNGITNYGSIGINAATSNFMSIDGKDRIFLTGNYDDGANSVRVSIGDHFNTHGMAITRGVNPIGGIRSLLDVQGDFTCDGATINDVMNLVPRTKPLNSASSIGDIYMDDGTCNTCGGTPTLRYFNGSNWISM